MRKKYNMDQSEIDSLASGIIGRGVNATYSIMRAKSITAISSKDDIDEMLMDMSDTILNLARKTSNTEGCFSKNIFYTLSFILKKIAHETHRKYLKSDKNRNTERFLTLVYTNDDPPNLMI